MGCQLVTMAGIIGGLVAGAGLLWELLDLMMLADNMYALAPDIGLNALTEAVDDALEDVLEPGIAACASLGIALLSAAASLVLTCLSPAGKD